MKYLIITCFFILSCSKCYAQSASYDKNLKRRYDNRSYFRKTTILTLSIGIKSWYKNNISKADSFSSPNFSENLTPLYIRAERTIANGFGIGIYGAYNRFSYFYYSPNTTATFDNKIQVGALGITGYYHFYRFVPIRYLDVYIAAGAGVNYIQHRFYTEYISIAATVRPPDALTTDLTPVLRIGARYFVDKHSALVIEGGYDKLSIINVGVSYRF